MNKDKTTKTLGGAHVGQHPLVLSLLDAVYENREELFDMYPLAEAGVGKEAYANVIAKIVLGTSKFGRILSEDYETTVEMTKDEFDRINSMSEEEAASHLQPLFQVQS